MEVLGLLLIGWMIYQAVSSLAGPKSTPSPTLASPRPGPGAVVRRSQTEARRPTDLIGEAIRSGRDIEFDYVDTKGARTHRTVKPARMAEYEFESGEGSSLCVEGLCRLRNESRTFAIRRMSGVRVV